MTDLDHIEIPEAVTALKHRKWQLFVLAYVGAAMGNAAEAARMAGYSKSSAKVRGCNLLKRQDIIQAVDMLTAHAIERADNQVTRSKIADADEVLEFLSGVMRGEIGDVVLCKDGFPVTDPATGETLEVSKVKDRIKASENLSKMLGLELRPQEQHLHLHGDITPIEAKAKLLKLREEND